MNDTTARNLLDKLGISELLNKEGITEVIINRPHEIFTESSEGFILHPAPDLSLNNLMQLANVLCILNQKHISAKDPMHSVTLPDGERGHIMIPPSCESGTAVFAFRKPSNTRFSLDDYIGSGRLSHFADTAEYANRQPHSIDQQLIHDVQTIFNIPPDIHLAQWEYEMLKHKADLNLSAFFALAIAKKCNICMVGGTGSGKTTFTKSLADLIDQQTRIITIEDTHELDLPNHPNHAHLFYKEHITAKQVIASCMRLKPDRIFLTELRGDEAWDYLSALNTGHQGGLTSVHANDSKSAFYRIAQLAKESSAGQGMDYEYILNTVRATIDIVCFFEKTHMTELYFDPVAKYYAMSGRN